MTTMTRFRVHAIDPARLTAIRAAGHDGHGNPFAAYPADGGEPLRCCLRRARPVERIALISYAPFVAPSPWREVGPVYVHADECAGYRGDGLPEELRAGARLLRTYHADLTMDYDHITIVTDGADGADLEAELGRLLAEPEVALVHVRTLVPQCFLYEVTR